MEYRETFKVKGKHGVHTGPAEKISYEVIDYASRLNNFDILDITIIKKSTGESADGYDVLDIISLLGEEGSELDVMATTDSNHPEKEEILKKSVRSIGKIIENTDRYTLRPH